MQLSRLSVAGAVLASLYIYGSAATSLAAELIPICAEHWAKTCVVDGDTIHLDGAKIRLEDIDAPETHSDQYKCAAEKALGDRATLRLQTLLSASPFTAVQVGNREHDRYGRELRTLEVDGKSVGQQLVAEGLAHEWVGHKLSWCD
jgi:micrococcal nuclease